MRCIGLFLLVLLCSSPAVAQEDVRISPPEPLLYAVPLESRIKSADSADGRTLVVWGASALVDDFTVVGELRFQLFQDSIPLTSQIVLTDSLARPAYHVQVVALAHSFLALWDDRRSDSPGLYAQRVTIDGMLEGKPKRLSGPIVPHPTYGRTIAVGGTPNKGQLLIWHESDSGKTWMNTLRVDPEGNLQPTIRTTEGVLTEPHRYRAGREFMIVNHSGAFVVGDSGYIVPRSVTPSLSYPFFIQGDTVVYMVVNNKLNKYSSIFSHNLIRSIPLPFLDSAIGNSVMVGQDSLGNVAVYFLTTRITGNESVVGDFLRTIYRITIQEDSIPKIEKAFEYNSYNGRYLVGASGSLSTVVGVSRVTGSYNSSRIALIFDRTAIIHGSHDITKRQSEFYSIDSTGRLRIDGLGYIPPQPDLSLTTGREDKDKSTLVVATIREKVYARVLSPITPWRVPTPQTHPMITPGSTSDTFQIVWNDTDDVFTLGTFPFPLEEGIPHSSLKILWVPFDFAHRTGGMVVDLVSKPIRHFHLVHTFPHNITLASNRADLYTYWVVYTESSKREWQSATQAFRIYRGNSNQWEQIYIEGTPPEETYSMYTFTESFILGYLADRGEYVIGTYDVQSSYPLGNTPPSVSSFPQIRGVDTTGKVTWKWNQGGKYPLASWLPVDSAEFIVVKSTELLRVRGDGILSSVPLPPAGENLRVTFLDSQTFLRTYILPDTPSIGMVELWSIYGEQLGSSTILNPPQDFRTRTYGIAWRGYDKVVVMLWGSSDSGIQGIVYDSTMHPLYTDLQISNWKGKGLNPSADFAGDSLVVVWEDYRNDNPDIYGNSLSIPYTRPYVVDTIKTDNVNEEEPIKERGTLAGGLWPNPAKEGIHLSFGGRTPEPITVDIFDLLGQKVFVRHIVAGTSGIWIDLHPFLPGHYIVRWHSERRSGRELMRVVR